MAEIARERRHTAFTTSDLVDRSMQSSGGGAPAGPLGKGPNVPGGQERARDRERWPAACGAHGGFHAQVMSPRLRALEALRTPHRGVQCGIGPGLAPASSRLAIGRLPWLGGPGCVPRQDNGGCAEAVPDRIVHDDTAVKT